MYIDLIILICLLLLSIIFFKRFSSFVYAFAIIDITLRILNFLVIKIPLRDLNNIFPSDITNIFAKYTNGIVYEILLWIYVIIYICFLVYTFIYFIRKKK